MQRNVLVLPCSLLLGCLALTACDGEDDASDGDALFTPGGCGLAPYEWLPASEVGAAVGYEQIAEVTAEDMDLQLIAGGLEQLTPVPHGARVYQLRYTTQDRGAVVEVSGLLALPWDAGPTGEPHTTLLNLHGTVGMAHECIHGFNGTQIEVLTAAVASIGFVAVSPDYIGLDRGADLEHPPPSRHPWLVMEPTAVASLDCLRAAETLLTEGDLAAEVQRTGQRVIHGASQGGHAVLAVDLLGPHYAPELEFAAAVAAVPVADLVALADAGLAQLGATSAIPAMIFATHRDWYQGPTLDEVLTAGPPHEVSATMAGFLEAGCFGDAKDFLNGLDSVDQAFTPAALAAAAGGEWDALDPWGCYLRENSPALATRVHRTRQIPMLFQVSGGDTLVPPAGQRAGFDMLCAQGYQLDYLECAGLDHNEGVYASLDRQVAWLADRLAGAPIPASELCVREAAITCEE